jgi:hypothetical protein
MLSFLKVDGKDKKSIKLTDDDKLRWKITVSEMIIRQYNALVDAALTNFRNYYRQSLVFSQVMDIVLTIPGDLHGGFFYFLQVVYLLDYESFYRRVSLQLDGNEFLEVMSQKRTCNQSVPSIDGLGSLVRSSMECMEHSLSTLVQNLIHIL